MGYIKDDGTEADLETLDKLTVKIISATNIRSAPIACLCGREWPS